MDSSSQSLLLVEDDNRVSDFLMEGFCEEGFTVTRAPDGQAALDALTTSTYDCIILDLMLPIVDGLQVCRQTRQQHITTPIVMLTAKSSMEDKITGLSAGADDYMVKPFSFEELLARIHAQIRRNGLYTDNLLHVADLELDLQTRKARRNDTNIELTSKEFKLLAYLMRHSSRTVSDRELIEQVWGMNFDPKTNVVNVYLHHLRNKIDRDQPVKLIHTIRGKGYRLTEKEPA